MRFPRIRYLIAILSIAMIAFVQPPAVAATDLTDGLYHSDVGDEAINALTELVDPYDSGLNPAFVSTETDPNIHLLADGGVTVSFMQDGAGYKNSFGYFVYDDDQNILYEETIFSNASEVGGGGSLMIGDTVSLGNFEAGTNIGFWITANGYNNPNGYTYYSLDQYNPDGLRHIAVVKDVVDGQHVMGFEDLYNLGDRDYNDLVFKAAAPEAGPVATALIGLALLGIRFRRPRPNARARRS